MIAAASDVKFALEEVAVQFKSATGMEVTLVFGSSGNFARQIEQGAPFEMFLSADEDLVLKLADSGKTIDRGQLYAIGRLVLLVPRGSALHADSELKDLAVALQDGRLKRLAIANPEHAPYGKRAEEVLRHSGLWESLQPHLLLADNVAQAAQFATSGGAQGGLVAYSLALAPPLAQSAEFALIPQSWHQPLRQRMVLVKGAGDAAKAFYGYLGGDQARAILARYGFVVPDTASR